MNKSKLIRILTAALVCVFATTLLAGCAGLDASTNADTAKAQADNRQYMSTLNQQMEQMQTVLADFNSAVSAKDAVGMGSQTTKAGQIIDAVKNTPATDELQSVKDKYVDALCTLNDALNAYVSLYKDNAAGSVDAEAYTARLVDIQSAYDNGMTKLEDADKTVKELNESNQVGGQQQ